MLIERVRELLFSDPAVAAAVLSITRDEGVITVILSEPICNGSPDTPAPVPTVATNSIELRDETVKTPYSAPFVNWLKSIGAGWTAPRWRFKASQKELVRGKLIELFGTDGTPVETTTIDVSADWRLEVENGLYLGGWCLASRLDRDSRVIESPFIAIMAGGWKPSGGSRKSPSVQVTDGTKIRVEGLPTSVVVAFRDKHPTLVAVANP